MHRFMHKFMHRSMHGKSAKCMHKFMHKIMHIIFVRDTYIGETKRVLYKRTGGNGKSKNNVIHNHCIENHHEFDFSSPKVLDVKKNIRKRKLSEMIYRTIASIYKRILEICIIHIQL